MAEGLIKPNNKIVAYGTPKIEIERNVGTATEMYPGRVVIKGSTDYDVVVATANAVAPIGWLGYETCNPNYKPADTTSATYAVGDKVPVLGGGGFIIVGTLATSQTIVKGDQLVCAANGQLAKKDTAAATNDYPVVAIAEESVTTTASTAPIMVRSLI